MDIPSELESFLSKKASLLGLVDIGFGLFQFSTVEKLVDFQMGYR